MARRHRLVFDEMLTSRHKDRRQMDAKVFGPAIFATMLALWCRRSAKLSDVATPIFGTAVVEVLCECFCPLPPSRAGSVATGPLAPARERDARHFSGFSAHDDCRDLATDDTESGGHPGPSSASTNSRVHPREILASSESSARECSDQSAPDGLVVSFSARTDRLSPRGSLSSRGHRKSTSWYHA